MSELCKNKIAIIMYSTDEQYQEECMCYLEQLELSEEFTIDVFVGGGDANIADFYNEAMNASDAKYKLYLSEKTFILQKDCLAQCIQLFQNNEKLGMLGILGAVGEKQKLGKGICSDGEETTLLDYQERRAEYYIADALENVFLFTQYDIPWSEVISEQGERFVENGYQIAVPYQDIAWCQIDKEVALPGSEDAKQLYNYMKFMLRRVQFLFPEEFVQDFYEDYEEGYIDRQIIDEILKREILYKRRVEHMLEIGAKHLSYGKVDGMPGKVMNIMTSLNRNYVGQVCVMLESVCQNHPSAEIHAYMLHSELTEDDQRLIREHAQKWGAKVQFIEIDRVLFEKMPTTDMWTLEAFYRLAMTEILPDDVERILYLDVDTIVVRPIYEFYFADFEGKDLLACKDMGSKIPFGDIRDEIFGEWIGQKDFVYCCSGVTLWNLKKIRQTITLETYLQVAEELEYGILAPDQDLINLVHRQQIKVVDEYRYDCFVKGYHWTVDEVKRYVSILHYAGPTKPWSGKYLKLDAYKVWWEYAKSTPLYWEMLEKAYEESYQIEKWVFNLLTRA